MKILRSLALTVGFTAGLSPTLLQAGQADPSREERVRGGSRRRSVLPVPARPKDVKSPSPAAPTAGEARTNPKDGLVYVWIPPGGFQMGCAPEDADCDADESPRHPVTIGRGFWMGQTEVTVAAYGKSAAAPEGQEGTDHPVLKVSWGEAKAFCEWSGGRLPSEAEWEYAARGGGEGSRYPWGNSITHEQANYSGTGGRDGWERTAPVGSFPPNGFGLFDMSGNVWEWVQDSYHDSYAGAPSDGTAWEGGGQPLLRGGSWFCLSKYVRTSNRNWVQGDLRRDLDGFRCVRDVAP